METRLKWILAHCWMHTGPKAKLYPTMPSFSSIHMSIWLSLWLLCDIVAVQGFASIQAADRRKLSDASLNQASGQKHVIQLFQQSNGGDLDSCSSAQRRHFIWTFASLLVGTTCFPQESQASYSAYTRREQDWEARTKNGEVQYSSARDLRKQLREIAPQNSENSRIFCPNGPSAAVSPLMENKCGDRMAAPSVYGRSNDALGNSIPGFSDQWKVDGGSLTDSAGGFPSYSGTSGKMK